MAEQRDFFVSYVGELTDEDRQALSRPGWKLYKDGIGATAAFRGDEMPPVRWRQIVRLQASDSDEAGRLVLNALGRQPGGFRVDEGRPSRP
jgi:hypothetical protein